MFIMKSTRGSWVMEKHDDSPSAIVRRILLEFSPRCYLPREQRMLVSLECSQRADVPLWIMCDGQVVWNGRPWTERAWPVPEKGYPRCGKEEEETRPSLASPRVSVIIASGEL